jgi:hypothetical protein
MKSIIAGIYITTAAIWALGLWSADVVAAAATEGTDETKSNNRNRRLRRAANVVKVEKIEQADRRKKQEEAVRTINRILDRSDDDERINHKNHNNNDNNNDNRQLVEAGTIANINNNKRPIAEITNKRDIDDEEVLFMFTNVLQRNEYSMSPVSLEANFGRINMLL